MLDVRWRAKVERMVEPVGRGLVRAGVTADWLTVVGLAFSVLSAVLIAMGPTLGWRLRTATAKRLILWSAN